MSVELLIIKKAVSVIDGFNYIDGNHKNNKRNNLITLCANCHRLEHEKRRTG